MSDLISRDAVLSLPIYNEKNLYGNIIREYVDIEDVKQLPPIQPKRGRWIMDRSGAYCCSECMEPCAGYVMMKPRDKFCKMCGAKMEVNNESN